MTPTRYISGIAHKEMPGVCPACERDIKWPVFVCDGYDTDGKPTNEVAVGSGCARKLVGLPPKKGGDRATKAERDMLDAITKARRDAFMALVPTLPDRALRLRVAPMTIMGRPLDEAACSLGSVLLGCLESMSVENAVKWIRRTDARLESGQFPTLPRGYTLAEVKQ